MLSGVVSPDGASSPLAPPSLVAPLSGELSPVFDVVVGVVRGPVCGGGAVVVALARQLGIFDSFEFPGFVRGAELERIFTMADVYVMPSRSEPFGISPLEAMAYDTPVIVSRQSGVSEVLRHALKVDYWDVDRMAQLILAVVRHQSLSNEMLEMGTREVLQLHWKAAAQKVVHVYHEVLGQSPVVEELCYPF